MATEKGRKGEDERQEKLATEPAVKPGEELIPPANRDGDDPKEISKETLLPVSGMVRLSPRELAVIDHPAFQRLFEIYQLGQTHLVYRGATHMRGEHAIGCVAAATSMIEAIARNATRVADSATDYWQQGPPLSPVEIAFARLGALLHDIGHLPAGHTLEDELGLLPKHDGEERINSLLDQTEWRDSTVDSLRSLIDASYADEAALAAQKKPGGKLTASELLLRLISSDHKDAKSTPGSDFRVGVLRDIIGNTICADLIDYLQRDWLHIGKPRAFDPRLLEYMMILTRSKNGETESRLVIDVGKKGRPRPDAVTAIMDLLESRYQLSEIALYHRVKLAATGMLERAIAEYRDTFPEKAQAKAMRELVPKLIECSDAELTSLLEEKLTARRDKGDPKRIDAAVELCRRLRLRKLHRDFYSVYRDDLAPATVTQIGARYASDPTTVEREGAPAAAREAAKNRLDAVRALEHELELPPCSVVLYCPPLEMNSKIAEVGIYNRGLVASLVNLDSGGEITGGYLAALQARFQRLWRISFALDPDVCSELERDGIAEAFQRLIDRTTLWVRGDLEDTADGPVRAVAETLVARKGSPWFEHEVADRALSREQVDLHHPGGAPSARSFIKAKPKGG